MVPVLCWVIACSGATAQRPATPSGPDGLKPEPAVLTVEGVKEEPDEAARRRELQAADRRAALTRVLERFEVRAADDPELMAFVSALLEYCSLHGRRVEIRVRRKRAQYLNVIDDMMRKRQNYTGPELLPAQYFDGKWADGREQRLTENLRAQLQQAFSTERVKFVVAPPVAGAHDSAQGVPVLAIEYSLALSGEFMGNKLHRPFMGLTGVYRSFFTIPGEEQLDVQTALVARAGPRDDR
jgi:hypothetical protein